MKNTLVIDIETWPEDESVLEKFADPPAQPTEFDPGAVKVGNLKDPEKIALKIEEARIAHEAEQKELLNPENRLAKVREKACLKGHLCRIYAFGAKDDGFIDEIDQIPSPTIDQERVIVKRLVDIIASHLMNAGGNAKIAGWNTEGFDIPIIFQRAVILGIPIPFHLDTPVWRNPWSLDLARVWSLGSGRGEGHYTSLGTVAKSLGLGGKRDLGGELPWQVCVASPETARLYLERDIELTWEVGKRIMSVF
jgi:hypothetical protein